MTHEEAVRVALSRCPTGRKFCSRCGRWRQVWEFGLVIQRGRFQPDCRTCDRRHRRGGRERLPVAPFRGWLAARIPPTGNPERVRFLRSVSLDNSAAGRILDGQKVIHIDVVDRALLQYPTNLYELYPELAEVAA